MARTVKVGPYRFVAASNLRAGHARASLYAHVVEGRLVSTAQIAKRVGISHAAAAGRAKRGPHPLTWSNLSQSRLTQSTKEQQQ